MDILTKEYLEEVIQYKSIKQISQENNVNSHYIYKKIKLFGIKSLKNKNDYTGRTFGSWLVISKHPIRKATWICRCECGIEKPVRSCNFLSGSTTKCNNCKKTGCGEISGTLWSNIRNSAIQRNLNFELTVQDAWKLFLIQNRKCALTGIEIYFASRGVTKTRKSTTASLDRIDSKKGYSIHNIQWVYKKINMMKQGYDIKEFIDLCKKVAKYNESI